MKFNKHMSTILAVILMFSISLTFSACGGSDDNTGETTASKETKVTTETKDTSEKDAKKASLATKASKMNKDPENFYGTWYATSETARLYYDHLIITINRDGTFDADVADEKFSGTWKKIDGGIEYTSVLMEGKIFYGKTCKMTIGNEGLEVTMKKKK